MNLESLLVGNEDGRFYTRTEVKEKFELPMRQALALMRQAVEETQVIVLRAEFLKIAAEDLLGGNVVKVTDVQKKLHECIDETRGVESSSLEAGVRVSRAIKMIIEVIQQCED